MAAPESADQRAERLVEGLLPERTPKKRMLVIVNPYATTVSARLKNLVVYALQSRYDVEAVDTQDRDHATEICRQAATEGFDVVVAFGGDGTVNEAGNGLANSDTPLTALPGGSTNVWCRTLGIPNDVVDATEHLLLMADEFHPRRVDLGTVNERYFLFGAGIGLDASVVELVDSHPSLKSRLGPWYYIYAAVSVFGRRYLVRPPRVRVRAGERALEAVTVIVQNSDPYTYLASRPITLSEGAELTSGALSLTALRRTTPLDVLTLVRRILSSGAAAVLRHRHVEGFAVNEARVDGIDGHPFPLQVDGDYIGRVESATFAVAPRALSVVA